MYLALRIRRSRRHLETSTAHSTCVTKLLSEMEGTEQFSDPDAKATAAALKRVKLAIADELAADDVVEVE